MTETFFSSSNILPSLGQDPFLPYPNQSSIHHLKICCYCFRPTDVAVKATLSNVHPKTEHEDPLISVVDVGGWSKPRSGCSTLETGTQYPIVQQAAWFLGPVFEGCRKSRLHWDSTPGSSRP